MSDSARTDDPGGPQDDDHPLHGASWDVPSNSTEGTKSPKSSEPASAARQPTLGQPTLGQPASSSRRPSPAPVPGPRLRRQHLHSHRRRIALPVTLFLITCLSTFLAGISDWQPALLIDSVLAGNTDIRRLIIRNGGQGLTYMLSIVGILLAHEMGHFIATLYYRIPASFPMFIPFPITPIGTMGAVIGMDGRMANRKEIFDIGIAGPIAGLVVAVPILFLGVWQLDLTGPAYGTERYDCPLLIEWMIAWLRPGVGAVSEVRTGQLNAYFMAGWVGLLITGLNMLPVSQLDGGHVIYALFGRRAHWIARAFVFLAIAFVVFGDSMIWAPMIVLVVLLGTDHPPTSNDYVSLGNFRIGLGLLSLLIPVLCFPPYGIRVLM